MAIDEQHVFYHSTIDFPFNESREEVCIHVFNCIEAMLDYLEGDESPLREQLQAPSGIVDKKYVDDDSDGNETEREVSKLVLGMRYPSDYTGGLDHSGESCLISIAEVGNGSPATPEYWACDYDFFPGGGQAEDDYLINGRPSDRWHISICTNATASALRVQIHITYYLVSGKWADGYYVTGSEYLLRGVLENLLAPWRGFHPLVGNTPVFDMPLSLDYSFMPNSKASGATPELVKGDIVDAASLPKVCGIPVLLDDLSAYAADNEVDAHEIVDALSSTRWILFESMMHDRERLLPVVLVCSDRMGEFPIDIDELAIRTGGMANVFYADLTDPKVNKRLNILFKRTGSEYAYRCRPGFTKVYPGRIDITGTADVTRCLSYSKADIRSMDRWLFPDDLVVPYDLVLLQPTAEEGFHNVASLAHVRAEAAFNRLTNAIGNLDLVDSEGARSYEHTIVNDAKLIVENQEMSDWADFLESENMSLAAEKNGLMSTLAEVKRGRSVLQERYNGLVDECHEYRDRITQLQDGQQILNAIDLKLPTKVDDVLSLIEEVYPDRVVVLPQAHKSAERIGARNLDSAWRILRYIPTILWSMFFENTSPEIEREFESQTGYPLALNESESTCSDKDLMKKRSFKYDNELVDFVSHIKGGTKSDPLRVHFFKDTKRQLIVIGHCGVPSIVFRTFVSQGPVPVAGASSVS